MNQQKPSARDCIAVSAIPGIGSMLSKRLISYGDGDVAHLLNSKAEYLKHIPGIGDGLSSSISGTDCYRRADEVLEFTSKFGIRVLTFFDSDYPERLKQCEDCPLVIFIKGQPINNHMKFLAIVGTRNATQRGQAFCRQLVEDAHNRHPDICIVSGLAYGIDVAAHRASLDFDVPTIGVLGHGLDTIYPASHRDIAIEMTKKGCLLTEFFPKVYPDKNNFVRRNRIIAGLCDATLVVESDIKGGSLITAGIANSYNRDVFAVPGRCTDKTSLGCNMLIKNNEAYLTESFADIEKTLGWDIRPKAVQRQLFVELDPDSKKIYDVLQENDMTIDELCRKIDMPMSRVSALLLTMELNGHIHCLPGKIFSIS